MSVNQTNSLPRFGPDRDAVHRVVSLRDELFITGGLILDGTLSRDTTNTSDEDVLQAGLPLGKITASGKFANSILGLSTVDYTTGTSLSVSVAAAAEIVRRIGTSGTFNITGPPPAGGAVVTELVTFSAVDTGSGVVTVSAITADFDAGSFIQPTDGSQDILGIVGNGFGIKVTDEDRVDQDSELALFVIGGHLDTDKIVFVPTQADLLAFLKSELRDNSQGFSFNDDYKA